MRILLNKHRHKKSTNANNTLAVKFKNSKSIIPSTDMRVAINEFDLYNEERLSSSKIRLTCAVNTVCSNVLFNYFTEIVKNEGSDDCIVLNYNIKTSEITTSKLSYKAASHFGQIEDAIRDTQLTNSKNNWEYHCGLNIFDNHLLRSKTFKTVCKLKSGQSPHFNTLSDYMRDINGNSISGYTDSGSQKEKGFAQHLYLADEVHTFEEAVDANLIEQNGWYGFINTGKFPTYSNGDMLDIYKVINNRKTCDFIDLYPSRDLFSFKPKYNTHRKRVEKNWHYALTYPSSSTTENISFINTVDGLNSLKIMLFDDNVKTQNGTHGLKIISVSKHGLSKGDYVNVYSTYDDKNELLLSKATVVNVVNEYTFIVHNELKNISQSWYSISIDDFAKKEFFIDDEEYTISNNKKFAMKDSVYYYILDNSKVNLDATKLNLSYKQVVDGYEVDYYVRIFSRLPNFKYSDTQPTQYEMYRNNSDLISRYQTVDNEFESHVANLAFAKNIFNDDIAEIVYTDDIDIANLKDNLGRPLSSLYLTFFKNNSGYKKWYGVNGYGGDLTVGVTDDSIEYSHCFGKLNCAFRLSNESIVDTTHKNSICINNLDGGNQYKGLDMFTLNGNRPCPCPHDEIHYDKCPTGIIVSTINDEGVEGMQVVLDESGEMYVGDRHFYGDLCAYSPIKLEEKSIQQIEFRFNTAQRELGSGSESYKYFKELKHHEILSDDYDLNGFVCSAITENFSGRREGYVYNPHIEIPIKTFSTNIQIAKPSYLVIEDMKYSFTKNGYTVLTKYAHQLSQYDKVTIKYGLEYYSGYIKEVINDRTFFCDFNHVFNTSTFDYDKITMFSPKAGTPDYAALSKEGSCYYMWREIVENGFDKNSDIETYPFVNGAFYINKNINLFVRRQDPEDVFKLEGDSFMFDQKSETYKQTDTYYEEEDITC